MFPLYFNNDKEYWKIPAGYALVFFLGGLPVWSVALAGYIAKSHSCVVDEAGSHPCVIGGADYGDLLSLMFVFGWSFLLFFPLGIAGLVLWAKKVKERFKFFKQSQRFEWTDFKNIVKKMVDGRMRLDTTIIHQGQERVLAIFFAHRKEERKIMGGKVQQIEGLLREDPVYHVLILDKSRVIMQR
ncbi:MAG TPA: hypothetical protein VFE53_18420 [Mucilaginibacter sp.]|nr:hypothetical protein [Mucilaginibacter sp.]